MPLTPIATIAICTDCYVTAHDGWDPDWLGPLPTPEPLSLLHPDNILGDPLDENGEEEFTRSAHFSNSPCRTCGSTLAGDRYDMDVYSTCI